jgi:hypothetical protein
MAITNIRFGEAWFQQKQTGKCFYTAKLHNASVYETTSDAFERARKQPGVKTFTSGDKYEILVSSSEASDAARTPLLSWRLEEIEKGEFQQY